MLDLVELFTHWHAGRSQVQLSASLGIDRKTVRYADILSGVMILNCVFTQVDRLRTRLQEKRQGVLVSSTGSLGAEAAA